MTTPTRPTTYAAVDALLHERSDHLRIVEEHRRAYRFGLCMQMLAQANREIARLERKVSELEAESGESMFAHEDSCTCEVCNYERAADTAREMR